MMVWLYKEYNEEYAYCEEDIQVFGDKERALSHWKSIVGEQFEQPFDPQSEDLILDYEANMSYEKDAGYAFYNWGSSYWIVEPKVVC